MDITEEEFERAMKLFQGYIETIYKNHEQTTENSCAVGGNVERSGLSVYETEEEHARQRNI